MEAKMITNQDFSNICRLCISAANGKLQPLSQLITLNLLNTLIQIDINAENLPKNICCQCVMQLENIQKFVENCQNCNVILETIADVSHIEVTSCNIDSENEELDFKSQKPEIQQEEGFTFKCFECQRLFPTKESLSFHMSSHRKNKRFECLECSAKFPYEENLKTHSLDIHGKKPFVCKICQESFVRKRSLDEHKNIHTGETPYVCTHCGQAFKASGQLNRHMYRMHNPNLSETPKFERKYVEKRVHLHLECEECGKIYASRSGFENHQMNHKGIKKHLCSICGKQFLVNSELEKHMKFHNERSKTFNCTECDKSFTARITLLGHLRKVHTLEEIHKCPQCDIVFKTKDDLVNHLNSHPDPLPCSYCGKTFHKKYHLRRHLYKEHLTHFSCKICTKKFETPSHLDSHMRVHDGKRPYECTVCAKAFSHKQVLTVHMRMHLGITPYECTECDKKYHDSSSYRKHFKRHHEKDN